MNIPTAARRLSPREQAALMDAARRRAVEARNEAVDAFWDAALGHLASAWHALVRAAHRPATPLSAKEPSCRP